MNIEEALLQEHSRRQTDRIAAWIGADKKRFRMLMDLFLESEPLVAARSAWVVSVCADRHPSLVPPYLDRMIGRMLQPGMHDAVRRNIMHVLQTAEIPPKLQGKAATVCFDFLACADIPAAIKVYSMTVIARLARDAPELGRELRLIIDQQLPIAPAAFRARARQVTKALRQCNASD